MSYPQMGRHSRLINSRCCQLRYPSCVQDLVACQPRSFRVTTAWTLVYSLATIEWDAVASATAYGRHVGAVHDT